MSYAPPDIGVAREARTAAEARAAVVVALPGPALDHLNWVRGLAALAVLVGHVRGLFFLDFDGLPRKSVPLAALYLFSGLGHEAVIVFFVLSGFFIGTSVLGVTDPRPWSWPRFLANRFTRLYVVLVPALLLTALWDVSGVSLFGSDGTIYAGRFPGPHMVLNDVRRTLGVPTLLGNLAFLQDVFVRPYGSNGPLWSLSYEFWFYLTFPLLVRAFGGPAPWLARLLMGAAAAVVMAAGGAAFLLYFLIWGLGALVASAWPRLAGARVLALRTPAVLLAGGLFVASVVVSRVRVLGPIWRGDLALGAAAALFFAVLLAHARRRGLAVGVPQDDGALPRLRRGYAASGRTLADFSYTLYLVHYPPLVFLYAWLIRSDRWSPDPPHLLAGASIAALVLAGYAYPVSRMTEAHTDRVRRWLSGSPGTGWWAVGPRAASAPR